MKFKYLDINNTYWNGEGKFQKVAEYVEQNIMTSLPDLGIGISVNNANKYRRLSRQYYEFYNDGKIPRGFSNYNLQHTADFLENSIDSILNIIKEIKGL